MLLTYSLFPMGTQAVVSEPSTYKESEWHLIPRNSLVTASAENGVEVAPIAYKKEWDAEDPTVVGGK